MKPVLPVRAPRGILNLHPDCPLCSLGASLKAELAMVRSNASNASALVGRAATDMATSGSLSESDSVVVL